MIDTEIMTRKQMAQKTTTERKDTTPKHVKNTQTGVEPKTCFRIRWYHIAATVGVLVLVIFAILRVSGFLDPSLLVSKYTMKYALGCTTSITGRVERSAASYRYIGVAEGMMFGKNGKTDREEEAYLKITQLGDKKITIQVRSFADKEWSENQIDYGKEYAVATKQSPDCMPGISYTINH